MRLRLFVRSIGLAMVVSMAGAQDQPADKSVPQPAVMPVAAAPVKKYDTTNTLIGTLLDDPAAKAVLAKYIPEMFRRLDQAVTRTLKDIQAVMVAYAPNILMDAVLAKIDQELAKLPAKN